MFPKRDYSLSFSSCRSRAFVVFLVGVPSRACADDIRCCSLRLNGTARPACDSHTSKQTAVKHVGNKQLLFVFVFVFGFHLVATSIGMIGLNICGQSCSPPEAVERVGVVLRRAGRDAEEARFGVTFSGRRGTDFRPATTWLPPPPPLHAVSQFVRDNIIQKESITRAKENYWTHRSPPLAALAALAALLLLLADDGGVWSERGGVVDRRGIGFLPPGDALSHEHSRHIPARSTRVKQSLLCSRFYGT
jgi:hypothetical protein